MFVVYDTRTGPTELVGKGSLVLLGVSDTQLVAEALSSATAPGAGNGWGFPGQASGGMSFAMSGSGQDAAAVPAMLDTPTSSLSAMELIAT